MAAPKGNKYTQEWTLENAQPRFEDALKYAMENDECLCLQDAIFQTGIPVSTFKYLVANQKVLASIKEEIMSAIIIRVNKRAIKNEAPAAAAIWRMKQLGEIDEQHVNQTGNTQPPINITVQSSGAKISTSEDEVDGSK